MDQRRPSAEINQHVALEIEAPWLESIKYKAGISMHREPPANPTIFRVPSSLQHWNKCDHEPKLVSIGPYHRGKSMDLKAMEELKWRMLHHYLSIVPNGSNNENLRKMKDLEKQARNCYSEVIDLNSDQFMEMLLLDGCFLVQIFIVRYDRENLLVRELESLLFCNRWFKRLIFRDLLLLENQLPYFIVKHLLDTLSMPGWDNFRLQKAIISSFIGFLPDKKYIPRQSKQLEQELEVDHFLHLLHNWLSNIPKLNNLGNRRSCWQLPSILHCSALCLTINQTMHCLSKLLPCCNNPLPLEKPPSETIPTMTELVEAGVKIKVRKANIFLAISFCKDKGELGIPAIDVHDYINFLFINLIAFEQCCRKHGLDVTHYTIFLDDIINTSRDVQLLCKEGIIRRSLGDDESIALLVNKLGKGVTYDASKNYLKDVYKDLNTYCQSRCHTWRAKLVHDYFSNPWAFISLAAAVLLIVFTILQAVYAALGYYKGNQQQ